MPVPPHVFDVDETGVVYGAFPRLEQGLGGGDLASCAVAEDTFTPGPLGGTLRSSTALVQAIGEVTGGLERPPEQASILVPDRWLRLLFVDLEEDPGADRDNVLRWKLKKLVPFRVEDMRIASIDVKGADDERRALVAFGVEALLAGVEGAFRSADIRVGHLSSRSLALMSLLERSGDNVIVVHLEAGGYSMFVLADGEPLLVRYRALEVGSWSDENRAGVTRDCRLMRVFLRERFPGVCFSRAVVSSPRSLVEGWTEILEACFEVPASALGAEDLPLTTGAAGEIDERLPPLVGAALREVA
jgi:hypothetical protein